MDEVVFCHSSYDEFTDFDKEDIVYCDPPYASTKKYKDDFDNNKFWEWARKVSKKAKHVYISEYDAPDDFKCIWQMKKKDGLGRKKGKKQNIRVEKLFVYCGK